jgi:hypothetical protein
MLLMALVPNIFSTDCKIVERKAMIKQRAVDSDMGNLSTNRKGNHLGLAKCRRKISQID